MLGFILQVEGSQFESCAQDRKVVTDALLKHRSGHGFQRRLSVYMGFSAQGLVTVGTRAGRSWPRALVPHFSTGRV